MPTTLLKLAQIVTTAGTQIRAAIDAETVDQYAQDMADATIKFPPIVVFHDSRQFLLADGFHRLLGAARNGFLDIEAIVLKGTKSDALRYALSANSSHGLKRTNADKHRSVVLALEEWPELSDREIARICAVVHETVASVRRELLSNLASSEHSQPRIGADGKKRRMPAKKAPEPSEPSEPTSAQPTQSEPPQAEPEAIAPAPSEPERTEPVSQYASECDEVNVCLADARCIVDYLERGDLSGAIEACEAVKKDAANIEKRLKKLQAKHT